MMDRGFVAPSINIENYDEDIPAINVAREPIETELKTAMSNSFGFGGTNGSVIFAKV